MVQNKNIAADQCAGGDDMRWKHLTSVAAACVTLLLHLLAGAAEPPSEPILRIETGVHTAPIRRIATDAEGRWLATVSDDKTLRIWDLKRVELRKTLRPPVDAGNRGKLYSVAMSPDGRLVATGGWTSWDRGYCIYEFQRETGHMVRSIDGLPNVILDLAWSPDGRYLAVGLGGRNGIRVYRSDNYALVGQDDDYGGLVSSLDFDGRGRVVASGCDGLIRLYQVGSGGLERLQKKAAPGGGRPEGVRFSPDGKTIAVGFYDAACVNLLSAESLDFISAPETESPTRASPMSRERLPVVCWSADGDTLFAGGTVKSDSGRSRILLAWPKAGQGKVRDVEAAYNTILDIRPLAGGGVAFSAFDPAWGVIDGSGQKTAYVTAATADFRDNWQNFLVSGDGLQVCFSMEARGTDILCFNLADRLYETPEGYAGLLPPHLTASGMDFKGWNSTTQPTLNGQPLVLARKERSRCLAIAPDKQSFLIGAEWSLNCFDGSGGLRWKREVAGTVWGVNISGDGRFAVAAHADGTIRWHRMSDGEELLAFFPHPDRKRWVAWTPSGYYDTSVGGEDLIGWHLNNGRDQAADFFPASRFRDKFYRPELICSAFGILKKDGAPLQVAKETSCPEPTPPVDLRKVLPPIVEILSPSDGETASQSDVTLKVNTRTPEDSPVTGFRARVNGQAVKITVNADEVTVPIVPQDCTIQLFAENKNGVSVPATLSVVWKSAAPAKSEDEFEIKPKLYVMAVGVSQYDNPKYKLELAAKDAKDFAAALQDQQGQLYREVEIKLLTDKEASRGEVLDSLDWLQRQVTQNDIGMLFLAGHGINDPNGVYYYLPCNADVSRLKSTGVMFMEIKNTLASLAGKALFFIDTCHSGNVLGDQRRAVARDITGAINELASAENGVVVFSSSTGRQYSLENPEWGNGAFTKALVEGLKGKASFSKTGRITHKMLDFYVSERVKELTEGQQTPVTQTPGGVPDFPIAVANKE
jgi:WD40 repeat protein